SMGPRRPSSLTSREGREIMIRRFFALILMSFIGIATAIVPATAQTQSMGHNVAGTWKVSATGTHFQNGSYAIQQVNQNIIGKNSAGGQLQGKMKDPSTVQGTWRGPSGETGWFNMHLTP